MYSATAAIPATGVLIVPVVVALLQTERYLAVAATTREETGDGSSGSAT
ncbi:MAG TPA: hypothetical protein VH482_21390 [Thermomicrobiales bacterium]